jgi:Double zinc ribbon/zinc-ribbon domain
MYCIHCGKENPSSARFCMHCGKAIPTLKPKNEPHPQPIEEIRQEPATDILAADKTPLGAGETTPLPEKPVEQLKFQPKPEPKPKSKSTTSKKGYAKRQPIVRERCPMCGFAIRPGIRFCEGCGNYLHHIKLSTCKACGYVNRPGTAYCEGCGKTLDVEPWEGEACLSCGYPNRVGVRFCEGCGVNWLAQGETAAREKQQAVKQLRKVGFKMIKRYILPRVLGGSVGGFIAGKLGQWVFQNLL